MNKIFFLLFLSTFTVGCSKNHDEEITTKKNKPATLKVTHPGAVKNPTATKIYWAEFETKPQTKLSRYYGHYDLIKQEGSNKEIGWRFQYKENFCPETAQIGNANVKKLSETLNPNANYQYVAETAHLKTFDVLTKEPIATDVIMISGYLSQNEEVYCFDVAVRAFNDRGTWSSGRNTMSYKFEGNVLTEGSALTEENLNIDIEILEQRENQLNITIRERTGHSATYVLKKR